MNDYCPSFFLLPRANSQPIRSLTREHEMSDVKHQQWSENKRKQSSEYWLAMKSVTDEMFIAIERKQTPQRHCIRIDPPLTGFKSEIAS